MIASQLPPLEAREQSLRRRLRIPDGAARVLIFAESSHWDPDWLYTSEEYFHRWAGANLDRAIDELAREPRRVYSVECMFFLRLYWEARPQQRDKVQSLVNEGRLRLTSSGVTTADTIVPRSEAILRDWLLGQEWLRANGMTQEPRLAYFTDSFGCSPALPSLLRAAGFDRTAITRVDGMHFIGSDYESASHFPRRGSTAEFLAEEKRTLDFLWRGPDGAEVLCHWNAFTYGQGDMLAHRGLTRMYIVPLALPSRSDRAVAGRIESFARQLLPLSRTPYLFCPIGFDFVPPIPDLVALLDRYNANHYRHSGIWAVNAGLDDYLTFVELYRDRLPSLELDPNPYWTGFYTSRPALKKECHELVDDLLLAERLALLPANEGAEAAIAGELADPWWAAATANHHDFITGTSPDKVVDAEQLPMLERARGTARAAIERLAPVAAPAEPAPAEPAPIPQWKSEAGKVEVQTPHYTVVLSEAAGGGIVDAWDAAGTSVLGGVSNDLVSYRDSGGLWRMGLEFRGGTFRELTRASDRPAALEVREREGGLEVSCAVELDGESIRRLYWFACDTPLVRLRVEGRAAKGRTVTVRFATGLAAADLAMDTPGGVVTRPRARFYAPTFWPVQRFWHAQDQDSGRGMALLLGLPGAVACRPGGAVEAVALRNATRERAWGLLPLLANPATGYERAAYAFDYALAFTATGDWRANDLPLLASGMARSPCDDGGAALREAVAGLARTDRPEVTVTALKPASRGEGLIVRLQTLSAAGSPVSVTLEGRKVKKALLCDARERDLEPVKVRRGAVHLTMPGNIATLRLLLARERTPHHPPNVGG